jgi:hypothetical protein
MKNYHFYDLRTGEIHRHSFSASDHEAVSTNTPPGCAAIEGQYDREAQRVDISTGQVIDYQPPAPSADHEWNADTKRWQLTAAAADKISRSNAARARIAQLEAAQHRHVREHCLGVAGAAAELKKIDAEISSLESQIL